MCRPDGGAADLLRMFASITLRRNVASWPYQYIHDPIPDPWPCANNPHNIYKDVPLKNALGYQTPYNAINRAGKISYRRAVWRRDPLKDSNGQSERLDMVNELA
jgi:hypothetical protein